MDVYGARIDVGIVWPNRVEQPFSREDAAGMLQKMPEQAKLGRAKRDLLARSAYPVRGDVHLDVGIAELLASKGGAHAPQDCSDARHELARTERLSDIVVGTGLEAADSVTLLTARGEHDDRHVGGGRAAAQAA